MNSALLRRKSLKDDDALAAAMRAAAARRGMGACASEGPFARPSVELRGKGGNTLSWSLIERIERKPT